MARICVDVCFDVDDDVYDAMSAEQLQAWRERIENALEDSLNKLGNLNLNNVEALNWDEL